MSLEITNFSLAVGGWGYANSGVSVDITDLANTVTTSGCYFKLDGTTVSSTLTPITNGYRMLYNPVDGFESIYGPTELEANGSNDIGETISSPFYITFGYIVDFENRKQDGIDFGYSTEVVVRASAENLASCPIKNAEAYVFETEVMSGRDIGASIVGVLPTEFSQNEDLGACIYPQSTAFFYGQIYRVVLTAKDFAGNEMEPLEFEFKIEDKPE